MSPYDMAKDLGNTSSNLLPTDSAPELTDSYNTDIIGDADGDVNGYGKNQ